MPDSSTSSSTFSWILLSDSLVPLGAAFEALEVVDDEEQDIEHLDVHQLVLIKGKHEKELKNVTILTNNLPADEHNFSRVLKIVRLSEIDKSSISIDGKLLLGASSTMTAIDAAGLSGQAAMQYQKETSALAVHSGCFCFEYYDSVEPAFLLDTYME